MDTEPKGVALTADPVVVRITVSSIAGDPLVNRTYGGHKNLYIHLFLPTIFGPIYYRPL